MAYSSETTIENRVAAARIKLWGDRDRSGTIDPGLLAAALSSAQSLIDSYLAARFGSLLETWAVGSLPPLIGHVSDDLTLFYLATGSNAISPAIQANYDRAIAILQDLQAGTLTLTDTTGIVGLSAPQAAVTHGHLARCHRRSGMFSSDWFGQRNT